MYYKKLKADITPIDKDSEEFKMLQVRVVVQRYLP